MIDLSRLTQKSGDYRRGLHIAVRGRVLPVVARPGSGLSDQDRIDWLEQLSPPRLEASLAMCYSDGSPACFVRPRFVVEVEAQAEKRIAETITKGWDLHGAPKAETPAAKKSKVKKKTSAIME